MLGGVSYSQGLGGFKMSNIKIRKIRNMINSLPSSHYPFY